MPKHKGGLGRGLDSLIPATPQATTDATPQASPTTGAAPQTVAEQPTSQAGVLAVPVDSIAPNPRQPRGTFDLEDLEDLAASIREHGVLQPLVVTQAGNEGSYNLIAGERRWRAAMLAGLEQVPVIVKETSSRGMLELALVENLQRADLNPLEEATAYRALVDDFGMKQDEVADRVGKSRQAVANSLRLLRLPPAIQEALAAGSMSEGHARALLQVPDTDLQLQLAQRIASEGLSVRQVEALARRLAEVAGAQEEAPEDEAAEGESESLYDPFRDLEEQFRNALGTKVQLSKSRRGGRLVIYFYSDEELERIYGTIIRDEADR
ncbi:MAG: ParB/RepB/Spo0J family partition protein [Chloroflexota bacterium]|nr:ParB/RepB/Spo0J family partition protein [Chloroflexota bacterium]MDQ5867865.1 ParB/RepB/Spo0J family partition protein [Chloroflexota bacterium]